MKYSIDSLIIWITPWNINPLEPSKFQKFTIHKMWPPQNVMILQCLNKFIKGYVFWIVYSVICTFQLFHKACYYILPESLGYDWYFHFAFVHQEQYFCTLIKSMFQFFHLFFSGKKFLFVAEIFAVFLSNVKIADYTITHLTRSKVKEVMADTQLNVLTPLAEIVTSEKV